MARQFKIEVEDHVFVADLLEDKAPRPARLSGMPSRLNRR